MIGKLFLHRRGLEIVEAKRIPLTGVSLQKYTLMITEKPDAARRIAFALDRKNKPRTVYENGVSYFVVQRDKKLIIVPALGHLYNIKQVKENREARYPLFNFKWVPIETGKKGMTDKRLQVISKLARDADAFIDACDYDVEGSLIGYFVLKYACGDKERKAKRMKFSTLTQQELVESYEELSHNLDFPAIEAGRTRHEVDWLYGINFSRALTDAVKKTSGRYVTMSTGRVQGPALRFLVRRERAIKAFVPTPYWSLKAEIAVNGSLVEAEYERKIDKKKDALLIQSCCEGKNCIVEKISICRFEQNPHCPFNLGTLQSEAYDLLGYSPMITARIAQSLYLKALISYPRTDSQKLPSYIDHKGIVEKLGHLPEYRFVAKELLGCPELKPGEGKRNDAAHPAIHPTGNIPQRNVSRAEAALFDLVARRYLSVFGRPAVKRRLKVILGISSHRFLFEKTSVLEEGWLHFHRPNGRSAEPVLGLKEGELLNVRKIVLEGKFTKPPNRFNQVSLLREMERVNIGTKATRSFIIETLLKRKYAEQQNLAVTDLGFEVMNVLQSYCSSITSLKLTQELQEKMNLIEEGNEERQKVLSDVIEILRPVMEKLRKNEETIGERLSKASRATRIRERALGKCPRCQVGDLVILRSAKTLKRFVGCTNYFRGLCKVSSPLPQYGMIVPLKKNCRECNWPVVQIRSRGRRSWNLCLNQKCPKKVSKKNLI